MEDCPRSSSSLSEAGAASLVMSATSHEASVAVVVVTDVIVDVSLEESSSSDSGCGTTKGFKDRNSACTHLQCSRYWCSLVAAYSCESDKACSSRAVQER
ncbi:hypothetical protein FOCC_FOCC004075 [Frankliniella occidentalis]|nr:hypothetical protein FOCC_FOCC004075 [Frankliniella occidentalis]